jgi:hypothetical protein
MGRKEEKEELQKRLNEIQKEEDNIEKIKVQEKRYQAFLNRIDDTVIGKAHADIDRPKSYIGDVISIHGNCGECYVANPNVTESTYTYFHNLWTDDDRHNFQKLINGIAIAEINKIMGNLRFKLEIMGLQSCEYSIKSFPDDKKELIKESIFDGVCEVLDKFKDEDFLGLICVESGWVEQDTNKPVPPYKDFSLSHGLRILVNYIKAKRPHLIEQFQVCSRWQQMEETNQD